MPQPPSPPPFPLSEPDPAGSGPVLQALLFVVAPEEALPHDPSGFAALQQAQHAGIGGAMALRMFRAPAAWSGSLDDLVAEGRADARGQDPFEPPAAPGPSAPSAERRRLLCDAVVPHLEARSHWVGVYAAEGPALPGAADRVTAAGSHPCRTLAIETLRCLDRFPLREADNETCWFYPTDDGLFLAWEKQLRVETLPGFLPERPVQEEAVRFERSDLRVLWSLMADDLALTCVGLTYRGRRIEWPLQSSRAEPFATWTAFRVDSAAESTYAELAAITVFES